MLDKFFDNLETQNAIVKFKAKLNDLTPTTQFESERNDLLVRILSNLQKATTYWNETTQFNIKHIGGVFIHELISEDKTGDAINMVFTTLFRFVIESNMFSQDKSDRVSESFKDFGIYRLDEFDEESKRQLQYAIREMPIQIVKNFVYSEEIKTYSDFVAKINEIKKIEDEWKTTIEEKEKRVNELNLALNRQESGFNFVGLYDGFFRLGELKRSELTWARRVLITLGCLILIPLFAELLYVMLASNVTYDLEHLIKVIPLVSITLIFIYYFRVALNNYNSVRAQVMQIELRKSLCCFIQSYSEYAKEIKVDNEGILTKFEEVVFSNIMTSEEKIPSTFDGLEQIANLIGAAKGGKTK